jgi:hypothetical protein
MTDVRAGKRAAGRVRMSRPDDVIVTETPAQELLRTRFRVGGAGSGKPLRWVRHEDATAADYEQRIAEMKAQAANFHASVEDGFAQSIAEEEARLTEFRESIGRRRKS